jgi:4-hydroxyproline epimerase
MLAFSFLPFPCASILLPLMRTVFECIDGHTCGNPVRVVKTSKPELHGATMSERRLHFIREYDWIRTGLMFEPRGHDMMSGSFIYPPINPEHDASILFIETSGCLPMCGHGTIGTVTMAIEEKLILPKVPGQLILEVPAGIINVKYTQEGHKVKNVTITNVPSFVMEKGLIATCPGLGILKCDVAYGGNFYAIVDVQGHFAGLEHYPADQLISWGRALREDINKRYTFIHPEDPSIAGCSHIMWTGTVLDKTSTARSAVIYGEKAIDRSPCGTGTSARMAQWFANGTLKLHQPFKHESVIGSKFIGMVESTTMVGNKPAIIPSIKGWAVITGYGCGRYR